MSSRTIREQRTIRRICTHIATVVTLCCQHKRPWHIRHTDFHSDSTATTSPQQPKRIAHASASRWSLLIEQKLATETKRANKASADYLRMLGERDQLEWLVKRQPDGDHRGRALSARFPQVCGLATTPRDSATMQCLEMKTRRELNIFNN